MLRAGWGKFVFAKSRARWLALFALALSVVIPIGAKLEAMRVSPMVVEMQTTGPRSTARVEVQNGSNGVLAFETRITRINYDAQGKQVDTPADNDFLVFPPQGTLPTNGRQVIRLQWLGGTDLPASRSYYLSVNQLPVALAPNEKNGGGEVQIIYHMKALITIAPPGAKPVIDVTAAEPDMIQPKAEEGKPASAPVPGLRVKVINRGNRYAMLAGATWIIEGMGTDKKPVHIELTREDLSKLIGVGYVAPLNGTRAFDVPVGKALLPGTVKIRFQP